MKKIGNKYIALTLLAGGLGLAACSNDEPTATTETAAVQFRLSAQGTDTNHPITEDQLMRLFVGERKPEHGVEELHLLGVAEDVKGGNLTFTNLKPQWYKFAFVCVPRNGNNKPLNLFTEENPGEATCDMNRLLVDYEPILTLGAGSETPDIALSAGDVYRKVVSLWLESGVTAKESVVLKRLNGQLVVDMGILCDQFEHHVDSVVLELTNHPTRLYITDNDKDEIKTTEYETVRFRTRPDDQSKVAEANRKHHKMMVNLLPCELDGNLIVYTQDVKYNKETFTFPLKRQSGNIFRIKPNTRTILYFNGIASEYFDVKYAGYDDTNIGVADDDWNGWPEPDTGSGNGGGNESEGGSGGEGEPNPNPAA